MGGRPGGEARAARVEIVFHVALNTFTNDVNEVAQTAIDFPIVSHRAKSSSRMARAFVTRAAAVEYL